MIEKRPSSRAALELCITIDFEKSIKTHQSLSRRGQTVETFLLIEAFAIFFF